MLKIEFYTSLLLHIFKTDIYCRPQTQWCDLEWVTSGRYIHTRR